MKTGIRTLVVFLALALAVPAANGFAQKTHVRAYTRKDGTRVGGYDRQAPKTDGIRPASPADADNRDAKYAPRVSLGALAASETARRSAVVRTAKIYTNADLAIPHQTNSASPWISSATSTARSPIIRAPASRTFPRNTIVRDAHGRIQRSAAARHAFARQTGFPHGRPGYVIDHIVPLACDGADAPANMQWQTIDAGKAKDKVERIGCR
jgi:hypothetical protein